MILTLMILPQSDRSSEPLASLSRASLELICALTLHSSGDSIPFSTIYCPHPPRSTIGPFQSNIAHLALTLNSNTPPRLGAGDAQGGCEDAVAVPGQPFS